MRSQIYAPAVLADFSVIMPKNEGNVLKGTFFEEYSEYLDLLRTTEAKDHNAVTKAMRETINQIEMFQELATRAKLNLYNEDETEDAELISPKKRGYTAIKKEIEFLEKVYRSLRKIQESARYM